MVPKRDSALLSLHCTGRVPIYVRPSLYRSLNLRYLLDLGGIFRDSRVTNQLDPGSLRQAIGILISADFQPVVDTE